MDEAAYAKYVQATEAMLQEEMLGVWYARAVDTCMWLPIGLRGRLESSHQLSIFVFQVRMTWVAAQVAPHRPSQREQYLPHVCHYHVDDTFHGEYELIRADGTTLAEVKGHIWKGELPRRARAHEC